MPDAPAPQRLTKRTLVTISHALERAALAAAEDGPMVVFALFQRLPYFERERQVYERIASRAAATVVGLVAAQAPQLPAGTYPVLLDEKEELAREWSVVVLTPRFGAVLVAHDLEEFQAGAATLESGRLFEGRSSFRRDEALHEALRLRHQLGDRLSPQALSAVDGVVARVRDLPATPGESRTDAALQLFAARAEQDHTRLRSGAHRAGPDAQRESGGRVDPADSPAMRQWTGATGVTASGVLAVAVLAVRVRHAESQEGPIGRTATRQQQAAVELLLARLRPADRATRTGPDDFRLYLPALGTEEAVAFAYGLIADFQAAQARSAFLSATVTVALTVTRRRPLPEDELRKALDWAVTRNAPVVTIAEE
ncbi:DICT sensory domain-containing protein [Paractinoplanes hotanensis]|uniref:Histidine kinase n=1 Tax=Paractinoplanes hotanensis TaxID=2906497 RepID=A0ABT0XW17_9ACTN|nr:DICT sensory domain-containing protein [Actinoplanes hotanensis]MCM4077986.1 histidine kinase [Actinoplanes hotanensis]